MTLNDKGLYRNLAKVALPIALQSLITSSLSLVDNLMVGSLGETELAAVGVSVQIYFLYWMIIYGFTGGCATFMAQFWGARDLKNIKKTAGFAITVCTVAGAVFFILATFFPHYVLRVFTDKEPVIILGEDYIKTAAVAFIWMGVTVPFTVTLRATQQTRVPLYISATAFTLNTVLNYVFIFGHFGAPKMGVLGAALATTIARTVEMILTLYVVFARENMIGGKIKEFTGWGRSMVKKIVENAIPTTLNESLWGLGTALYVAAYARTSIPEYAAVQASNTINNLFIMAAFSIGDATLILVGKTLGEGESEKAYFMAKKFLKISVITGLVSGGLLILCSDPLISCFDFTPEAAADAKIILIIYGATMFMAVYNGTNITGVLRCGGDTRFAMIGETMCIWLIGVPAAFITTMIFHWPIYLAVLAVKTEDFVKLFIMTYRFVSRKWVRNVIHSLE